MKSTIKQRYQRSEHFEAVISAVDVTYSSSLLPWSFFSNAGTRLAAFQSLASCEANVRIWFDDHSGLPL